MKLENVVSVFVLVMCSLFSAVSNADDGTKIVFFQIDDSLPSVVGTATMLDLVEAGIENWTFNLEGESLIVLKAERYSLNGRPMPPTLIVKLGATANEVPVSANQGGPKNIPAPGMKPLAITLNKSIKWNEKSVVAAVTHGMGHILGLNDSTESVGIMNLKSIEAGISDPSVAEVALVNRLWEIEPARINIQIP